MKKQELIEQLKAANIAYANAQPYLTDQEYDELWKQLYDLDPTNHVLYHTSQGDITDCTMRTHVRPILGMQKAFSMEDLKPFLHQFSDQELLIQPKYDGVAAVISRNPEGSIYPTTITLFGDGIKGRDITFHAPKILHQPPVSGNENVELIIPNDLWEDSMGKNPRNTVAGWVNSHQIPHPPTITAYSHEDGPHQIRVTPDRFEDLEETLLVCYNEWKKLIPLDGLILKVADPKTRLQHYSKGPCFGWCIAWKPPIQTAVTTVTDIEWNVSRSGRVIPTVVYEPIELCGTTNSRATGNNAKWFQDHVILIGNKITVGKAGEIIPKILKVQYDDKTRMGKSIPTICPTCKSELSWKGVDLICESPTCIAQLTKSLTYFYSNKGMEIKGFGEQMIYDLLQDNKLYTTLRNSPWALLYPWGYLIDLDISDTWGPKHFENYVSELTKTLGKYNPAHFIAALGLPGLAYKTALNCFQWYMGYEPKKYPTDRQVKVFMKALNKYIIACKELNDYKFANLPRPAKVTYCITGELSSPRSDMISYLSTKGWQFVNSVSKNTDYLVIGELSRETGKLKKANQLGTKTISEHELPNYLKD